MSEMVGPVPNASWKFWQAADTNERRNKAKVPVPQLTLLQLLNYTDWSILSHTFGMGNRDTIYMCNHHKVYLLKPFLSAPLDRIIDSISVNYCFVVSGPSDCLAISFLCLDSLSCRLSWLHSRRATYNNPFTRIVPQLCPLDGQMSDNGVRCYMADLIKTQYLRAL